MAHGRGLDDIPTDVVAEMASKAVDCEPDRQWWVDEIIIRKQIPQQLTAEQIECAAARYVDVLGIDEVIRRRILGVHLLVFRVDDENALDLAVQCGITDLGLLPVPNWQPGTCLTFSAEDGVAETSCDQPHEAEIYSVYDVDQTDWPGHDSIKEEAGQRCRADAEAIQTPAEGYGLDSTSPDRALWERGRRQIACVVIRADRQSWTGPSGLVPAQDPPADDSPPTAPPTTPPAAPTLVTESLPLLPGYVYVPWTEAENDAFLAGPYGPPDSQFVQRFAGGDVEVDGQVTAWIELHQLWPQYQAIADDVVLNAVSRNSYFPGPQTSEQVTVSGEQVLIRRIPTLTAWLWFHDGILFNVVANEIDPLNVSNFVAALTGTQQTN